MGAGEAEDADLAGGSEVPNNNEGVGVDLNSDEEASEDSLAGGLFAVGAVRGSDTREASERRVKGKTDMRMEEVRTNML